MTKMLSTFLTQSFGSVLYSVTLSIACIIASARNPDAGELIGVP